MLFRSPHTPPLPSFRIRCSPFDLFRLQLAAGEHAPAADDTPPLPDFWIRCSPSPFDLFQFQPAAGSTHQPRATDDATEMEAPSPMLATADPAARGGGLGGGGSAAPVWLPVACFCSPSRLGLTKERGRS